MPVATFSSFLADLRNRWVRIKTNVKESQKAIIKELNVF
jgi:hypothetical protein